MSPRTDDATAVPWMRLMPLDLEFNIGLAATAAPPPPVVVGVVAGVWDLLEEEETPVIGLATEAGVERAWEGVVEGGAGTAAAGAEDDM